MLRVLVATAGILLLSIVLVVIIGYSLPKQHVVARAISLPQKPAEVFALISNFKEGLTWRTDLQQVDILPDRDGHVRFQEKVKGMTITMEVAESTPPRRLVTRVDDKDLPFGGIWIFEISPDADGSRLNITERGEVYNPVFRFVSRFILGYQATLDTYLKSVARKFGSNSVPIEGHIADGNPPRELGFSCYAAQVIETT